MTVVAATQRDLDRLPPEVGQSALAAIALVLAVELDSAENDLEAKLTVVKTLSGILGQLQGAQSSVKVPADSLGDLAARRNTRLAGGSAT